MFFQNETAAGVQLVQSVFKSTASLKTMDIELAAVCCFCIQNDKIIWKFICVVLGSILRCLGETP